MVAASDPPENERYRRSPPSGGGGIIASRSSAVRGRDGDPPPMAPGGGGVSDVNSYSVEQRLPPANARSRMMYASDDSVGSSSARHRPIPPSVLRTGHYQGGTNNNTVVVGGINRANPPIGGGSSGGGGNGIGAQQVMELRNKRIASSRGGGGYYSIDNYPPSPPEHEGGVYNFAEKICALMMRSTSRKRMRLLASSAFSLSALVALLSFAYFHPAVRGTLKPASGTTTSRVLKDIPSSAGSGIPAMNTPEHAAAMTAAASSSFLDDFDQRRRRAADLPDGTVFAEPAHARMCRSIIDRLDARNADPTTAFERIIFTESEYVCRDPDAPYTAVLSMFAAQLLHVANNDIGLNVDYTHRCAKWERFCTGNLTTVQFHLPDPLSINAYAYQPGCLDAASLRTLCADSLASDDPGNPYNILFPNGYLNPETNACDLGCHFSQVLPWIRNNLRAMATDWLNTVETRALTFWLRNAAEFSHREKDDMEVSVVSLSCADDGCDMSNANCECKFDPLPNWAYAMHIPRSSTNVAVVVSPTCAKYGVGCTLHAQELYHFFQQLYPRADITYSVITSTSSYYMRMITADHLVCPPGVGCLLPAMARDAYTYAYENRPPALVSTWLTCAPEDYRGRYASPDFPPAFVQGDCRHLRARIGGWTPDAALAPSLQYGAPVDGYLGCADENYVATADEPYRAPTTHRWDETVWATCPVDVMTKDELCTQMDRLGLSRILFVGDHTTMTQAISLASILGQNDAISLDPNVVPNFTKTIPCPGVANVTNTTSFELTYVRNDRLEEPGTTPSPGFPNCGPTNEQYCYPWSGDFQVYEGRQLMIVNTGYHWGDDWAAYIANFQNFVGRIDEIAAANAVRVNDVIMFRTSIPGHKECHLHDTFYANYHEYCPRIVNGAFWHWWGELPPYNDYAIRIINEWNLLNTVKAGPDIELLDPWMMTVLRPDGHLSGSDAGPNCAVDPQECMLYSLPGPVDWWNHLLVMQLRDIGTHLENSNPMQAWR